MLSGIDSVRTQMTFQILSEAYSALGINLEFKEYPILRSTHSAHTGKVDGEVFKISGLDKKYPNLIKIPVPLDDIELMVMTRKDSSLHANWASLRYASVGYFRGIFLIERMIAAKKIRNAKPLETNEQLIKMVSLGRLDAGLIARIAGIMNLKKSQVNNVVLHPQPIAATPVYHYLNNKHADLVPELIKALKKMKETGRMKEIKRNILKQNLGISF